MKSRILWLTIIITTVLLMLSASAVSLSPYGYKQVQWSGPSWAHPNQGLGGWQAPPQFQRMRVERSADQDNYYVTILVAGMEPQSLSVTVEGDRWLAIRTEDSRESTYQNTAENGSAYYRSYSYSSGSNSRRISLPPDADVAALQREDGEGQVQVTIPRRR
jgi:HSP20 family molecular chaperone IbpA